MTEEKPINSFQIAEIVGDFELNFYCRTSNPTCIGQHTGCTLRFILTKDTLDPKYPPSERGIQEFFNYRVYPDSFQLHQGDYKDSLDFLATCKDGEKANFHIFTCTCGDPGCAGWFEGVQVEKRGKEVIWTFPDHENAEYSAHEAQQRKKTEMILPIEECNAFWDRLQATIKLHKGNKNSKMKDMFEDKNHYLPDPNNKK